MKQTKLQKEIARRNRIWARATKPQKRVIVAKEILAMVKSRQIRPYSGDWCVVDDLHRAHESAQEAIIGGETCRACQLGAITFATISFANKARTSQLYDIASHAAYETEYNKSEVQKLFSRSQLRLMEFCFEGGCGAVDEVGERSAKRALTLHDSFETSDDRMVAICKNIIKNGGMFRP